MKLNFPSREEPMDPEEGEESMLAALSRRFLFVGKDYGNWLVKDACEVDRPADG